MKIINQRKGIEDYMFWLFRFLIVAGIVFWIVALKNNALSQSYEVHSGEQAVLIALLNSKYGIINENRYVKTLTSEELEKMIYLVDRGIAYRLEIFDMEGNLIHGPVYSEHVEDEDDIKFKVYSPLVFDESYGSTRFEFLSTLHDDEEKLVKVSITTAYKTGK